MQELEAQVGPSISVHPEWGCAGMGHAPNALSYFCGSGGQCRGCRHQDLLTILPLKVRGKPRQASGSRRLRKNICLGSLPNFRAGACRCHCWRSMATPCLTGLGVGNIKDQEYKGEGCNSDGAQGLCMDHTKGMILHDLPKPQNNQHLT